jgi:diguanylate cyclase (GGDEF)-like protein/PAS domain S-box-containing protein
VRRTTRAALGVGTVSLALLLWLALDVGGATVTQWVDDLSVLAAVAVACATCVWAVRRGAGRPWGWLAAWLGCWAIGQAVWVVYELVLHRAVPTPSLVDVFLIGSVPFALVGLLMLPAGWRAATAVRSVVDGLMVAGSLVGAAWAPVLSPLARHGDHAALVIGLSYPCIDIMLVIVALWVAEHSVPGYRRPIAYLVGGVMAVGAADSAFGALAASGRYTTGQLWDVGWVLGFLLVAVAALSAVEVGRADEPAERPQLTAWLTAAPYLPLVALLASACIEQIVAGRVNGIVVLVAVPVGTLTVLRQAIVHLENSRLTDRLLGEIDHHRRAQASLAVAQQVAHLGSWEWDVDTGVVAWSDEHFRLLGYAPGEVEPSLEAYVARAHPDEHEAVTSHISRAAQTREPGGLVNRVLLPTGEVRWLRSHGTLVRTEQGTDKVVGTSLDITDAHRAEQDLLEAELRFQQGFEHSPVGMTMVDPEGVLLRANPAFCRLVGRTMVDTVGRRLLEFVHPEDVARIAHLRQEVLAGGPHADTEVRYVAPDGAIVWVHITSSLVRDERGSPLYFFGQIQDVTARRQAEGLLAYQARHDILTGLANRVTLIDALRDVGTDGAALLSIDLTGFTQINDGLGHDVGDLVLQEVARRLTACTRQGDLVSRIGGDEFAILLRGVDDIERASRVAATVVAAIGGALVLRDVPLHIGASVGAAVLPTGGGDGVVLLRQADLAMQRARREGGGLAEFLPSDDQDVAARLGLVADLRRALDNREITVHYQPKVDVATGAVLGVEALARWEHPVHGFIPPADFIPLAEQTGLVLPLTRHVLDEALAQWRYWCSEGIVLDLAVNLSPRVLVDPELTQWVTAALVVHDVPGRRLIFEITENSLAEGETALRAMADLRRLGVRLSVDDLGTGYSSLLYLKELPVDELKVDRAFIQHIADDPRDRAIVTTIVQLGRALGLSVVAEGVEDERGMAVLRELGCPVAQGYHCCRPQTGSDLTAWLSGRAPATAAH